MTSGSYHAKMVYTAIQGNTGRAIISNWLTDRDWHQRNDQEKTVISKSD